MLASQVWRGRVNQKGIIGVFAVGLIFGGLATSVVLWLVSGLASVIPPDGRSIVLVIVASVAASRDLGVVHFSLPQNPRQVPQTVFHRGIIGGTLQFGFELGTGVRTYLPAASPYVLAAAVVLKAESIPLAILAGAAFGFGRGLMPMMRYVSRRGEAWDARMTERLPWVTGASSVIALAVVWLLIAP